MGSDKRKFSAPSSFFAFQELIAQSSLRIAGWTRKKAIKSSGNEDLSRIPLVFVNFKALTLKWVNHGLFSMRRLLPSELTPNIKEITKMMNLISRIPAFKLFGFDIFHFSQSSRNFFFFFFFCGSSHQSSKTFNSICDPKVKHQKRLFSAR